MKERCKSGVYQIVNKENGKIYIGSSEDLKARKRAHFSLLKRNQHENIFLQRAYLKSPNSFEFFIIQYASIEEIRNIEQDYLNIVWDNCTNCYNISFDATAPTKNRKRSLETRQKISNAIKGEKHPNFGKKLKLETRQKIGTFHKGKKLTPEQRVKISQAQLGKKRKPHSEETKQKMRKKALGRKASEETKKKLSISHIGNKSRLGKKKIGPIIRTE